MRATLSKYMLSISLLLPILSSFSQNSEIRTSYNLFDEIVGIQNTGLSKGVEYIEQHIIRNDQHKYFLSSKFLDGNVHYDGQPYFNVPLKYNIYDDLLLVRIKNADGESIVQLHKKKIKSFSVNGHDFIHIPEEENLEQGFYEVLLDLSGGSLLKKHFKKIHKNLDKNFTYYEFENDVAQYVIFLDGSYYPIDSRRDLQKIFPDLEKDIRTFYRNHDSLQKNDPDLFMRRLLQHLNPVSKNPISN